MISVMLKKKLLTNNLAYTIDKKLWNKIELGNKG